ncbi:purine-nucleoside phosphorylase [Mesorhizobium sp. SP-1A]|uniref:purine-nucleoside phosphorylase n=1 Tax=Mesorhizobium sp. SP-1A TaxID=3077840 RepID=UPI0028F7442F|nr:purine-nucleoside phosphorylase [Mesorhizobium sp. SP-1A]
MSPHIEAGKGDYAATVLLAGDPQRTEWMAATFLNGARCVNRRRGALGFTGTYRGLPVSVQSTGIGASSFLIYLYELVSFYGASRLIRTGTCGALRAEVALRDLVISAAVQGEDAVSGQVFGLYAPGSGPDPILLARARALAQRFGIPHHVGLTACSDIFHHPAGRARFAGVQAAGALAVDMETSALYRLARNLRVRALSICTAVDNVVTEEETDYAERQGLFANMARLALETVVADAA